MNTHKEQKYNFHVNGMHCNSCVLTIEHELEQFENVFDVKVSLKDKSLQVVGDFDGRSSDDVAKELNDILNAFDYSISTQKEAIKYNWGEFKIAFPIAFAFILLFFGLQKLGLVNLIGGGNVTYGTALVVGIVASLSSCMAVVGGLLLSMSATFAKSGGKIKSHVMFHAGRIISFFVFGGVIGAIGSLFSLSAGINFALGLVIALVMLILGVNLLEVTQWTKKIQPSMPVSFAKKLKGVSKYSHSFTPFLVGLITFFLPCGFTQSMQLYTLSTGSFLKGGLTMLAFALGTLPVLALISFGSYSMKSSKKSGVFFKAAGLIVILFALFNLINSLVVIGWIPPVFNF